jgi:hypothetical protein
LLGAIKAFRGLILILICLIFGIADRVFQNREYGSTRRIDTFVFVVFLEFGKDSEGLSIALETPFVADASMKCPLSCVAVWRMPQVVRITGCYNESGVGQPFAYLRIVVMSTAEDFQESFANLARFY